MALGGLVTVDAMTRAREAGFEFVALGRSLVRDPDLPRKFEAGEARRSTCIHCNRCMPTIYSGTRCVLDDPQPLQISRTQGASA